MAIGLVSLDGGQDILVGASPMLVGRHLRCDACLDSVRVSRRHCLLVEADGGLVVRDLGSVNGVRINGRRVESGRLDPGDELTIAHLRFRVERAGTSSARGRAREFAPAAGGSTLGGASSISDSRPAPGTVRCDSSEWGDPIGRAVVAARPTGGSD